MGHLPRIYKITYKYVLFYYIVSRYVSYSNPAEFSLEALGGDEEACADVEIPGLSWPLCNASPC